MAGVAIVVFPAAVVGCPRCAVGEQARAEMLQNDFARQLGVTLLPFVMVGAISALAARVGRDE